MTILFLTIVFIFIVAVIYMFIYLKYSFLFSIKVETIKMQVPILMQDGIVQRTANIKNEFYENLIQQESVLRRLAYKNTTIKTSESFFDDSDMKSDYFLIVVFDKKSNTPLLTARYYFDKSVINKSINGDDTILNINKYKDGEVFLIDRMSGNNYSSMYRKHRAYIYLLFYSELFKRNRNCKIIAMARREKYEKLLTKYLRLGLTIVGSKMHNGKEHWILIGDFKKRYAQVKTATFLNIVLLIKNFS